MKKVIFALSSLLITLSAFAQQVTVTWSVSDPENLTQVSLTGDDASSQMLATDACLGASIARTRQITASNASTGFDPVTYDPAFTAFCPSTKVSSKTSGHCVSFIITPAQGHKFKPTSIAFDAMKVGTDGGSLDVFYQIGASSDVKLSPTPILVRNRVDGGNSTAYGHHEYILGDVLTDSEPFTLWFYFSNINGVDNSSPKEIALRNVTIAGAVDEEIATAGTYIKSMTFNGKLDNNGVTSIDITDLVAPLKNGGTAVYDKKLYATPTDFNLALADGYAYAVTFDGNVANVNILKDEVTVFSFFIRFKVSNREPKPAAKPLNRGLMAVSLTGAGMGTGNLVSWRHRVADGYGVKYKLYRGDAESQTIVFNRGAYFIDRTNFLDASGTADSYYKLETYDKAGKLLSTEVSGKTWNDQLFRIPLEKPADRNGASYTPNDAGYCDMDGDGEYEIILKWSPSNEKDPASSGATAPIYIDCIKLDGTRLWRIDAGHNFFTSAHTMQFIAWDFDGDGYGELMMKTAPGTIDGEGNFVLLGDDDPNEDLLSSRGKQDHGPEYITVFDGTTGGELATIPYHTDYAAGMSYWGDNNQNRSERYLAGLAYLDGPDANPSPIFARGYYRGAFVGAYDWDGTTLSERWVSRNTQSGKGLWGEGAHWVAIGDCDGDGKHEIVYGSAALDHDGSLLYRTGLGHGDALHLGDFLPQRPGMEVFMVHEEKPYGYDLRDAATGQFLVRKTAEGDTGRGLAAHFDDKSDHSQFIYSASAGMFDCADGSEIAPTWAIGSSGAGINCRIYWDGDLCDEFYDKSIIAHWNHDNKWFDRYKVNNTYYVAGTRNNGSKNNPCVLGDLLGDWREEIVQWETASDGSMNLVINATSYPTEYRIPHLMDDLNYRVQVVNQNCCYNQPPHLSFDPAIVYAGNPNKAQQKNDTSGIEDVEIDSDNGPEVIYNLQGIRIDRITSPGVYIINGRKTIVK